ncbi:MAG: hypothetical protein ACREP7_20315, partial [Lysobacter sp.]
MNERETFERAQSAEAPAVTAAVAGRVSISPLSDSVCADSDAPTPTPEESTLALRSGHVAVGASESARIDAGTD